MSNDLISRQAAIEAMRELPHEYNTKEQRARTGGIAACQTIIRELPSVQPEQKTGRWEHDCGHFANRWICSQCGYKLYFEKSEAKYCPNCGAKMKSEEIE